jgi:DNA-binding CsgD family transcriptional regulator
MKWGPMGYSAREMQIISWCTQGARPKDMALELGITTHYACTLISRIYRKSGAHRTAALRRWAITNAMDVSLPPETEETREIVPPKRFKGKIKLGRLRRAGVGRGAHALGGRFRS